MRYCLRNMIYGLRRMIYLLRKHDIISVPIIREAYIIRVSGFHRVSDLIRDQRERISLKKALAFASAFFWWGRTDSFAFSFPFGNENRGVDTVEPVSSDSPPDCRMWDLRIRPPFLPPQKTAILADSGFSWWGRTDSNHRSETQQIYSLSPLATRELPRICGYVLKTWLL